MIKESMNRNVFFKVFVVYVSVVILAVSITGIIAASQIDKSLKAKIKEELLAYGRLISLMPEDEVLKNIMIVGDMTKSRITLIRSSGEVVADSEQKTSKLDEHLNRSEIQEVRIKGTGEAIRYSKSLKVDMLYIALPVKKNNQITGYIRLSRPLEEVKASIGNLIKTIFPLALIMIATAVLVSLFFFIKLIQPIKEIIFYLEDVRLHKKDSFLLVHSQDEFGQLSKTINEMVAEHHEEVRMINEEKRKFEAVFSSMVEGILILNSKNKIESVNSHFANILMNILIFILFLLWNILK